ncbi:dTDP-4-dehydrorhamnose 3,5-epimerase [Pseudooctadecabacter jejudonensis]|uniref:dTDP-4-dehydrorhamnose 3,5-epimerase n=1 Tax=Pseudooctadecabacter jejudonensis TaxID=1391910 RepID=A0A1Y5TEH5_9RHOB|nr:dTDP-4-dehydrorhamnose 3,5-epimerase [Pseudooctadecabacter jejudonensis]SLN62002.1 dTDP-4-dehydrorhamnose 3,5-epimerase [Pseudooctadecabacter jejudonensis]
MANLSVETTKLDGVRLIQPHRFGDSRGFFSEVFNLATFHGAGFDDVFVQDNQSLSAHAGTLRGLHFQAPPRDQSKLVRCGRGSLWDVVVDFRLGSETFGQWFGAELSAANGKQMYVPSGFLHGFVTLEPQTEVLYKCSDYYVPDMEGTVAWDSLDIDWPLGGRTPILSDKDAAAPSFEDVASPFGALS